MKVAIIETMHALGLKSSDNNYGSINKEDVIIFNEEMNEDVPGNICYKNEV